MMRVHEYCQNHNNNNNNNNHNPLQFPLPTPRIMKDPRGSRAGVSTPRPLPILHKTGFVEAEARIAIRHRLRIYCAPNPRPLTADDRTKLRIYALAETLASAM